MKEGKIEVGKNGFSNEAVDERKGLSILVSAKTTESFKRLDRYMDGDNGWK